MLPGNFVLCDYGPHFSHGVGGMVSAPVGFSMLHGYRGIAPHLRGFEINGGWMFLGFWLNIGGLGGFRFYPALAFLFSFICFLYSLPFRLSILCSCAARSMSKRPRSAAQESARMTGRWERSAFGAADLDALEADGVVVRAPLHLQESE